MYELKITDMTWQYVLEGLIDIRLGNEARGVELIERGLTEDVRWTVGELGEAEIVDTIGFSAAVAYDNITGAAIASGFQELLKEEGIVLAPIPDGALRTKLDRLQAQEE